MKRATKTEKAVADQRQNAIAQEQRAGGRGPDGLALQACCLNASPTERGYKWEYPPAPLSKDADALDRAVHDLECENYARRQRGQLPLSYGKHQIALMQKAAEAKKRGQNADDHS